MRALFVCFFVYCLCLLKVGIAGAKKIQVAFRKGAEGKKEKKKT